MDALHALAVAALSKLKPTRYVAVLVVIIRISGGGQDRANANSLPRRSRIETAGDAEHVMTALPPRVARPSDFAYDGNLRCRPPRRL